MKFVWWLLDNYALSYTDFSARTFVLWQVVTNNGMLPSTGNISSKTCPMLTINGLNHRQNDLSDELCCMLIGLILFEIYNSNTGRLQTPSQYSFLC